VPGDLGNFTFTSKDIFVERFSEKYDLRVEIRAG